MAENKTTGRHRAGFVNIIGNPNVGKSTLMNALVGEKLSIVTAKAQTTRHRIMGIVNGDDYQIVYSDTPGILKPNYRLQKNMMDFVDAAIGDADIILYVTDVVEKADKNADYIARLQKLECPVILVINKIDISDQTKVGELMGWWKQQLPKAEIFPVSAQEKFNLENVYEAIVKNLPESPAWFDKDAFTDKNLRFFASEIIREKILLNYDKEIPYSVEVEVESFKEVERKKSFSPKDGLSAERSFSDNGLSGEAGPSLHISAVIYCERDSQKGIIIGRAGSALKRVGSMARKDIEEFFQRPVFLELFVKVDRDWRSNQNRLRHYGYDLS